MTVSFTRAEQRRERRARAFAYAQAIRQGLSTNEIAAAEGITRQMVEYVLARACPDFLAINGLSPYRLKYPRVEEPSPPPKLVIDRRPTWSRPGGLLLAIARGELDPR